MPGKEAGSKQTERLPQGSLPFTSHILVCQNIILSTGILSRNLMPIQQTKYCENNKYYTYFTLTEREKDPVARSHRGREESTYLSQEIIIKYVKK